MDMDGFRDVYGPVGGSGVLGGGRVVWIARRVCRHKGTLAIIGGILFFSQTDLIRFILSLFKPSKKLVWKPDVKSIRPY